jgi:NIPSNAP
MTPPHHFTDLADDPFCELRIYRVAAGRARDMEQRVQDDLRTLFPKHGIRPLASWSTLASPVSPALVYLTPWRNMNQRSTSWAGFYGDPEWAEIRARTNAGSELVESYEVMFVRALTPWVGGVEDTGFSELIIQSTAIGETVALAAELNEHSIPLLTAAGACVHGVFDMLSGRALPSLTMFLGWNSLEQRTDALAKLDTRCNDLRATGEPVLLERAEQHLLLPVAVDWA